MFFGIRRRLTYTNVAITVALVFAMSGGALAANRYLITSTKQISPKVLKALQGKNGASGAQGSAGPAGKEGLAGKEGPTGKEGTAGKEGAAGKEGPAGKEGAAGKEGSPWTAGGTLPAEKSETGSWNTDAPGNAPPYSWLFTISFPIELGGALGEGEVHYVGEHGNGTTCPGSATEPNATPGNLCLYQAFAIGVEEEEGHAKASISPVSTAFITSDVQGTSTSGALVNIPRDKEEPVLAFGTWAVTEK
jgi:hypothetical protein